MLKTKRKIVYFGNKISKYRKSNAAMETLEPLLADFCEIKTYSNVQNKFGKMADMVFQFFKNGLKSDLILIDVFSTTNFYFAYILSILSIIFRKPYILVLRGGNLPYRYKDSEKQVHRIFKNARDIIAPSNYLKFFFEARGYAITYIPNIIDLALYDFKIRTPVLPKILYIRGFGKVYNPQMTIRTIKVLSEIYPDVKLVMLGSDIDGTLAECKKLITELKLEKNIEILGKMTRDEWVTFSKNFDIMLSNPILDNTPVSIIEGMALGLLIISTDVGGISYLLSDKEDALLVPSNNYAKMAEAVKQLIENPDLCSTLQTNARKKAETFSWKNIKPEWIKILTR
jgi:glycosyltransferase involved in cell wall biosynthesis